MLIVRLFFNFVNGCIYSVLVLVDGGVGRGRQVGDRCALFGCGCQV